MCRSLTILAVLAALLLPTGMLHAESFNETISIFEVEVPVQVRRGNEPIDDLTIDDFAIYDNGVMQKIVGFERVVREPASAVGAVDGAATEIAPHERRKILLLFDFVFSSPHKMTRALQGARAMLDEQLAAGDEIGVAIYNGTRGVSLINGFSSDREEVRLALDVVDATLARKPRKARLAQSALAGLQEGETPLTRLSAGLGWTAGLALEARALPMVEVVPAGDGVIRSGVEGAAPVLEASLRSGEVGGIRTTFAGSAADLVGDLGAEDEISVVRQMTRSLSNLATLLRDVPGSSRHVLYFSQGFPPGLLMEPRALTELNRFRQAFLRTGWTLQSIDLSGIPGAFDAKMARGSNDSLYYMANETGGELYQNYNRFEEATEQFLERQRVSYILRFQPSKMEADGEGHRLKVELKNAAANAKVMHRDFYYAPLPAAKRSPLERRLDAVDLLFGDAVVEDLKVHASAHAAGDAKANIALEIDGAALLAASASPVTSTTVDIQGYVLDQFGGVAGFFETRFELRPSEIEALRTEGLTFATDLDLPQGAHTLRVLVQHAESGRFYLGTVALEEGSRARTDGV